MRIGLAAVAALFATPVLAGNCLDYGDFSYLEEGAVRLSESSVRVGNDIYVAGNGSIARFSIGSDGSLTETGSASMTGSGWALTPDGSSVWTHDAIELLEFDLDLNPITAVDGVQGPVYDVFPLGSNVLIAAWEEIVVVNPANGNVVGSLSTSITNRGLVLLDSVAYSANSADGLLVIDVSNPASPSLITTLVPGTVTSDVAMSADESRLFVIIDGAVWTVDITTPTSPVLATEILPSNLFSTGELKVDGNRLVITTIQAVFEYDVTDPDAPVAIGGSPVALSNTSVASSIDNVIHSFGSTIATVSFADPLPAAVGSVTLTAGTLLTTSVDHALVSRLDGTAQLVSFASPTAPVLVGDLIDVGGFGPIVALDAANADRMLAVVNNFTSAVTVLDVTSVPFTTHASITAGADLRAAHLLGDELTLLTENGLEMHDISTAGAPAMLGSLPLTSGVRADRDGDRVVVTRGATGVSVVDVSNPMAPVLLGTDDTDLGFRNTIYVAVDGDVALVTVSDPTMGEVRALDVSGAPTLLDVIPAPQLSSPTVDLAGTVGVMAIIGGVRPLGVGSGGALAASGTWGAPTADAGFLTDRTTGEATGVVRLGGEGRVELIPPPCPGITPIEGAPSTPDGAIVPGVHLLAAGTGARVELRYLVEDGTAAALDLFDVTGRRVAGLVDASTGSSAGRAYWEATTPGVYWARLQAGGLTTTRRLTLVW